MIGLKMSSNNPFKPQNLKLESSKVRIWTFFFVASAIYAIVVLLIISSPVLSDSVKVFMIFSYAIIAPISFYVIWLLFYHWNAKKWPQNETMFGGKNQYLVLFFLLGICVINWAAYWNTGIDSVWLAIAVLITVFTGDELIGMIIYAIGAYAITPALVEEFNKSLPSILAFFVVLQRNAKPEEKRKGMLGNELNGFLIGILIGLAFESIETAGYIVITIISGGSAFDIYLQVTLRNWGPIHILGGALGGYAAGRAERLRFELREENLPTKQQIKNFIKRFVPIWLIPVSLHFLWNSVAVWIFLIFLAFNILEESVFVISIIVAQLILAFISYLFLLKYYKRANRIAENTYRCPNTGMIVAHQYVICNDLAEKGETKLPIAVNYCPNCGNEKKTSDMFCKFCGINFEQFLTRSKSRKLYESFTMKLFIVAIIAGILFMIYSMLFFLLILLIIGSIGWYLFFTQSIIELITAVMILYAAFSLRKLRKNYDGKKSIWSWMFLIYNLIGMTGALIFMSVYLLINISFSILVGETQLLIYALAILLVLIFIATIITFFFRKVLLKETQVLHYQRWF
ncbi:MAG: zinc ribbon domain-containing protein [Promethearchaeota archaeon]|nr:MAG: zinc ribbon domain-containing protein [Candidatus Lokiarchaeota archaeon]